MAEKVKPLQGQVVKPPLLDAFLAEQQELTAVERFSQAHDRGLPEEQGKYYQALIPSSLPEAGQQYAFEVDLDLCSGCKACITGCHNLNGLEENETWRAVGLIHGENKSETVFQSVPLSDAGPSSQLVGNVQYNPELRNYYQQNITTACHHCEEPSCLTGCPVKAYEKDGVTGIVKHLSDQCIGCKYCMFTCSYGVPQYNTKLGIVRKCDMCAGRLQSGEAPACVQSCPNEAIRIRVIERSEVHSNPGKYFQIPSAPDPNYSKPTTRYKTKRPIPDGIVAADHASLNAQSSEFPLVFMLVLTQLSVGIFVILTLFQRLFQSGSVENTFVMLQSLSALSFGFAGLGFSLLHLGRPRYAFRAFLGFRTSWLSREVVFFSVFITLAVPAAVILCFPSLFHSHVLRSVLCYAVTVVGLTGVFASGMLYKVTPRAWWNSWQTLIKFFLTAAVLSLAWTLVLLRLYVLNPPYILSGILLLFIGLKVFIEAQIFSHVNDAPEHPLRKTAAMMTGMFKNLVILRFVLALSGALLVFTANPTLSFIIFSFLFSGECLERHLFFRAVAPPKMPGHIVTE